MKRRRTLRAIFACLDRHSAAGWLLMAVVYIAWFLLRHGGH